MTTRNVPYVALDRQWHAERQDLLPTIDEILSSGSWIGGSVIAALETDLARLCDRSFAVALNSGTDALVLALLLCGIKPGDEIITVPNSFIASASAILHIGAVPVFVDVLDDQNMDPEQAEQAITERTKAILPVHLTGHMSEMQAIRDVATRHNLLVIEDAAQAIGSKFRGVASGAWGDIGCFSTHPLKNLNAAGDGGFLVTDDGDWAARAKSLRSHGLQDRETVTELGFVSRMDALQAAILHYRLCHLSETISMRRRRAARYIEDLANLPIRLPQNGSEYFDTFHTFVIQTADRDDLRKFLSSHNVRTSIHYPVLIPYQPAVQKRTHVVFGSLSIAKRQAQSILSLPIHQCLTDDEISHVIQTVRDFFTS